MRLYEKALPDDLEAAYLVPLSDLHVGDLHHNDKYLRGLLQWVSETPNCFLLLNGDLANVATKTSKTDVYEETRNPKEQRDYLVNLFLPFSDRVLGITEGNHERRIRELTSLDICEDLAKALSPTGQIPYGREALALKVTLGKDSHNRRVAYVIYMTHGWSAARTPGAKVNMTTSLGNVVLADVYITGHTHEKFAMQRDFLVPDPQNNTIRQAKQLYVSCGADLDYEGYAVGRGYRPGSKGVPRIRLDGKRKDAHVSL
ncbi:MAG: metallophosphoesterase [Bacillota bacterium]